MEVPVWCMEVPVCVPLPCTPHVPLSAVWAETQNVAGIPRTNNGDVSIQQLRDIPCVPHVHGMLRLSCAWNAVPHVHGMPRLSKHRLHSNAAVSGTALGLMPSADARSRGLMPSGDALR